jgi:hypothetical protein
VRNHSHETRVESQVRRLRLLLIALLAAALAASALIARAGTSEPTAFRTPDAGAACRLAATTLVCSSLGSTGSVALRQRAGARVVTTLPWWDASTKVVHRWRSGRIACRLSGEAILCRNSGAAIRVDASGFELGRPHP